MLYGGGLTDGQLIGRSTRDGGEAVGSQLGDGSCVQCRAGHYCPGDQTERMCEGGTYNANRGSTRKAECQACPTYTHSERGATSMQQCLCREGYVDTRHGGDTTEPQAWPSPTPSSTGAPRR